MLALFCAISGVAHGFGSSDSTHHVNIVDDAQDPKGELATGMREAATDQADQAILAKVRQASESAENVIPFHAASISAGVAPPSNKKYRQKLDNFHNTQYYGAISVGGQTIHGFFDTGSFELLVLSSRCKKCQRAPYNQGLSTSYVAAPKSQEDRVTEMAFGSGPVLTVAGYEHVELGPYQVDNMPIREIVDHNIPMLESSDLDSIVGIGPGKKDRDDVSLMEAMGIMRYSVCLEPWDNSPGYFIWNDEDPEGNPMFTELDVTGKVHWGVHVENMRIKSKEGSLAFGCKDGCGAILDSGTSLIAAPKAALANLATTIDNLDPDCSNLSEMPVLQFEMSGRTLELPPEAYIARFVGIVPVTIWDALAFKPKGKAMEMVTQCVPMLMDLDTMETAEGPLWIIGMPFFRTYYTTFKPSERRVWVADATSECEPSSHASLLANGQKYKMMGLMTVDPETLRLPKYKEF